MSDNNKMSFGGSPHPDWFQKELQQTQIDNINGKLNKILWKLTELENSFQSGKVPVWIVKENPNWVHYDWWKIVAKDKV